VVVMVVVVVGGGGDAKLPVGTPRHANLQSSLCRHSNISLMPSQVSKQ